MYSIWLADLSCFTIQIEPRIKLFLEIVWNFVFDRFFRHIGFRRVGSRNWYVESLLANDIKRFM